jgi:pentatricopeptide repeat protein
VHGADWFVLMNSLNRMRSEGFTPDSMIFAAVIPPCGRVKELGTGMALPVRCGVGDDICVSNALVAMYCKHSCLDMAISLFQSISYKDVTSWSTIIAGHSQNGIHNVSANLFTEMVACGVKPNSSIMASILPCLSELKLLRYGKEIHCFSIRNAFEHSEFLTSALLYTEPEKKVMSRSGDECVVALTDQWYITIDKKVLGSALFFLMMVADGASRNVEHMGQLQMPWDPGGFHIFLVSVQQWKCGGFSLGECVEQLERYNMAPFYLRIWDADIQHSRLQETFHASLRAHLQTTEQLQNVQGWVCSKWHDVAWGQATFRRGGNVTSSPLVCGLVPQQPSPWPVLGFTKERQSTGEGIE